MAEPITAVYQETNGDWAVSVAGLGKKLTGHAPGIIAARDRVDQLVEKLSKEENLTVVHLLNGSALAFTSAYMTARLTRTEPYPALDVKPPAKRTAAKKTTTRAKTTGKSTSTSSARKPRPRAVPDLPEKAEPAPKPASRTKKSTEDKGPQAASA